MLVKIVLRNSNNHLFIFSIYAFPKYLKIAQFNSIFTKGDNLLITKHKAMSALPFFSRILERLMHSEFWTYLIEINILFNKQIRFRAAHITEHAITGLLDAILNGFSEEKYTQGAFIDLSKVFETANHQFCLSKLNIYGIIAKKLRWFKSYLSERKQYI